jgi:hypothetical protein
LGQKLGGPSSAFVGGKVGKVVVNGVTEKFLSGVAKGALAEVGPGSGAVHGTKVHTEFRNTIRSSLGGKLLNLHPETSYKGGTVVRYGKEGSARPDVVRGSPSRPGTVYDLKTGNSQLAPKQVQKIQQNLPKKLPVRKIRPDEE